MAVTKLSNSGIKTGNRKYDSMLAGNPAFDPAATWLIQRVAGTGSSTSITFSSIPQTYQHLQIRCMTRSTFSSTPIVMLMRFNSDSGVNYFAHNLYGDGSTATAGSAINDDYVRIVSSMTGANLSANIMGVSIIDIHDYASTSKNKTIRQFGGYDANGSGRANLNSGAWNSTSAISSITLFANNGNFTTNSTFALYGFKGV